MPTVALTYSELATRLGRSEIAAKSLAKRKRWKRSTGNDGLARITLDEADLADLAKGDRSRTDRPSGLSPATAAGTRGDRPPTDLPNPVHELQARLAVAQALASERERGLADLRADRDAWRTQAERLAGRPWWRRLVG